MTDEELAQLIAQGHETGGVEFKSSGDLGDARYQAKIVRAILGLANRRDGGVLVIGVCEREGKRLEIEGVGAEHLEGWNFDRLAGIVSGYADPSVEMMLDTRRVDGKTCLAISVREFAEIPVLCKKRYAERQAGSGKDNREVELLRAGACYVRSSRKPETTEVGSQEDMRALINLATEKGVRRWAELSRSAGPIAAVPGATESALAAYDREVEGLL
jgi:predicted HTH transcriptional regulator